MIRLIPQFCLCFIGIICFISGACIKNKKVMLVILIVLAVLIVVCFAFMVAGYTEWIEKILPLSSKINWA
jgi:CHASE2 domain-containing sensor protein